MTYTKYQKPVIDTAIASFSGKITEDGPFYQYEDNPTGPPTLLAGETEDKLEPVTDETELIEFEHKLGLLVSSWENSDDYKISQFIDKFNNTLHLASLLKETGSLIGQHFADGSNQEEGEDAPAKPEPPESIMLLNHVMVSALTKNTDSLVELAAEITPENFTKVVSSTLHSAIEQVNEGSDEQSEEEASAEDEDDKIVHINTSEESAEDSE